MIVSENHKGKKLIFLISQPRAGSTLTQKILAGHPKIHTVSEPWLMLPPLYLLRLQERDMAYNTQIASEALKDFFQILPNGEETHFEGLRRMYSYLYESALQGTGKSYFLDKTPRYYHIIPELYRTFPEAKFIILLRNPLAVCCSIISRWVQENWFQLYLFRDDLVQAPKLLIDGLKMLGDRAHILSYERLLLNPELEIEKLCYRTGLEFDPEMINYGLKGHQRLKLGDQEDIYKYTRPNPEKLDQWQADLGNAQVWRVVSDYLNLLGEDTLLPMGYDYTGLREILDHCRPNWLSLEHTFPLDWLLKHPQDEPKWDSKYHRLRLMRSLKFRGLSGTVLSVLRKLFQVEPLIALPQPHDSKLKGRFLP